MPARPKDKSPHRIGNVEKTAFMPVTLSTFSKGDLIVRHGTPCLVVEIGEAPGLLLPDDGKVWIVNLTNGKAWQASGADQVHPALDANLTYSTTRRES